jgi:hypothetical protein
MKTITSGKDTFEVVEEVPYGYQIWNIGKNMIDGYLPFCRLSSSRPFAGGMSIEADTLKAIKVDGAQTILAAVGYGPCTIKEMEDHISKYSKRKPHECNKMKAALPYMRQIKGMN